MAFKGLQGDNTKFRLEGWDEFIKTVQKLPDTMKSKAMRSIIAKNMKPVAAIIKANTPVRKKESHQGTIIRYKKNGDISTQSDPGNLKRSIGVKAFGKTQISVYAGIQNGRSLGEDAEGNKLGKKNDGWYGFFLERGTKNIPRNPFISRSAAIAVPAAAEHLTEDVKNYIVKNAQKLGLDAK